MAIGSVLAHHGESPTFALRSDRLAHRRYLSRPDSINGKGGPSIRNFLCRRYSCSSPALWDVSFVSVVRAIDLSDGHCCLALRTWPLESAQFSITDSMNRFAAVSAIVSSPWPDRWMINPWRW